MRFFLVAPLDVPEPTGDRSTRPAPESSDGTRARVRRDGTVLRSRIDSRDSEFAQSWERFEVDLGDDEFPDVVVETAWTVVERHQSVLALVVTMDASADTVAIESRLTDFVRAAVRRSVRFGERELLWVNRSALLEAGESAPAGWVDGVRATAVDLDTNGDLGPATELVAELGWGNNAISGWGGPLRGTPTEANGDAARWQVARGLIDAQVMWCELESLSARSAAVIGDLFEEPATGSGRSSRLRRQLASSERLSAGIAAHNLAFDDLLLNVQGPRRSIVESSLRAWRYEDVLGRIARRMRDLGDVLAQRKATMERRYQRLVEGVLSVLSVVTILDLVLSFIEIAYLGTNKVAGSASPLNLFGGIRHLDADWLIAEALVAVLAVSALVLVLRRRA